MRQENRTNDVNDYSMSTALWYQNRNNGYINWKKSRENMSEAEKTRMEQPDKTDPDMLRVFRNALKFEKDLPEYERRFERERKMNEKVSREKEQEYEEKMRYESPAEEMKRRRAAALAAHSYPTNVPPPPRFSIPAH